MIRVADTNGDGKIDFNEFVKASTFWIANLKYVLTLI